MQHRRNKKHNVYKEANEAFLQVKAQEEGMVVLDNGVLYKVLEQGHGTKKPTPRSIVYVHYTGRLIDGTVFDTTEGQPLPALFMVGDLIMGWQIALTRMHEGDKWDGLADCPDADARRRQMGSVHPRQMGLRRPEDGRHPRPQHPDFRPGARQDRAVTESETTE